MHNPVKSRPSRLAAAHSPISVRPVLLRIVPGAPQMSSGPAAAVEEAEAAEGSNSESGRSTPSNSSNAGPMSLSARLQVGK